ncbi:phosphohistidine phosphatase SixA [Pseudoalteromonas sp. T1lg65]|uniref:phosphohistidine phosphatase SixA n=1 Tax=Pseudoalteromonas sp. T1lg65 TaxID=2077101 RepID=UPI003F790E92
MKTILIMRHGEAQPMQADDSSRVLTERGVRQANEMANRIKQHLAIDAVLVSPYVRAQQTAECMLAVQAPHYVETCKDIVPSGSAGFAIDYLETLLDLHPEYNTWLLVAHMPIVSYLVEQLCADKLPIFCTAAVAEIHFDEQSKKAEFVTMHVPTS